LATLNIDYRRAPNTGSTVLLVCDNHGTETMNLPARFDHPAWIAGAATAISYVVGLVAMFVVLFVLPFLLFLGL
jgi:hypothetical protein